MGLKRSDVVAGSLRPNNAEDVAQHYRQNSAGVDSRAAGLEPEVESGRVDELGIRILDVGADPASADRRRAEVVVDEGAALRPRNADVLAGQVEDVVLDVRSEEHTSELQSRLHLVCRLLLEKKKYQVWSCSQ